MLLLAGFSSSSHPPHPIVRVEEAGWGEGLQNQGGASALLPGSPGARWEPVSAEGSPLPEPALRQGRRQSLPVSLPPSQAMERKLGQAALSCCLVGEGGGRTAVSPRPAGPSLGTGWGRGPVGSPTPTSNPTGVSEQKGPFSMHLMPAPAQGASE